MYRRQGCEHGRQMPATNIFGIGDKRRIGRISHQEGKKGEIRWSEFGKISVTGLSAVATFAAKECQRNLKMQMGSHAPVILKWTLTFDGNGGGFGKGDASALQYADPRL